MKILFTDLDGTLLDASYRPAGEALRALLDAGVMVVWCSSKTFDEQRHLAETLGVPGLFVTENGGGVGVPPGFPRCDLHAPPIEIGGWGIDYREVRRRLTEAAEETGVRIRPYGDMTPEEVAEVTGLTREEAERARNRRWSETFLVGRKPGVLVGALDRRGLRVQRGSRFWTTHGRHDKGTGVRWFLRRLRDRQLTTFAVGDAPNDLPMLAEVDHPILLPALDGRPFEADLPGLVRLDEPGHAGFSRAARIVLER